VARQAIRSLAGHSVQEVTMLDAEHVIKVKVWDLFVRVFHWTLASAVLIAWATDQPLWLHSWLGYVTAILVVLRVIWGFIGPEQARFVSFVRGPKLVFDYLAGLIRFASPRYLGHSPAGGAMIVSLQPPAPAWPIWRQIAGRGRSLA
jgi:cytochrome b